MSDRPRQPAFVPSDGGAWPLTTLVAESRRFSPQAETLLKSMGEVILADLDREELLTQVADVDVLWVRLRHQIDEEVLCSAPRMQYLLTATTGLNHVDLDAAAEHGVEVLSLRGETEFLRDVRATAEHTIALMLSLLRHVPAASQHVLDGGWDREKFVGRELCGMTVGIVGYGRLGRLVARFLNVLGSHVLADDPLIEPDSVEESVELVTLNELLSRSDLVSLHANLHTDNVGMFGIEQFVQMRRGAWFVNTARGELIDESALLLALETGQLSGAAIDVLADESSAGMGHHPLVRFAQTDDRLLITPHLGGCTQESTAKTEVYLAQKLCAAVAASRMCQNSSVESPLRSRQGEPTCLS